MRGDGTEGGEGGEEGEGKLLGTGGRAGIEGSVRGPRGPKNANTTQNRYKCYFVLIDNHNPGDDSPKRYGGCSRGEDKVG